MLVKKSILQIKPYLPGRPIEEVKREFHLRNVVKLASNENPLGPSPKAVRAIKSALGQINRYPDGDCFYLKKKLAKKLGLKPHNLVFGCGCDELIVLTLRAFVDPGQEVIIARPTFLIYELASQVAQARIKYVPLKDFHYDLPAMKKAISAKTKVVFIANPDNPTGTYVTSREVDSFMQGLPKDLIVYFDEAYYELAQRPDYASGLKYLNSHNVVVGRTFSKAYGLSGLRIGYGIARPQTIDYLNRVREPFNVNSLAQVGALAALDDQAHLLRTRRILRQGKEYLYQNLRRLNLPYIESAANFILINAGKNAPGIYQSLLRKGVIVRSMQDWGMDNFIRVTIGTMPENRRFIKELQEILTK